MMVHFLHDWQPTTVELLVVPVVPQPNTSRPVQWTSMIANPAIWAWDSYYEGGPLHDRPMGHVRCPLGAPGTRVELRGADDHPRCAPPCNRCTPLPGCAWSTGNQCRHYTNPVAEITSVGCRLVEKITEEELWAVGLNQRLGHVHADFWYRWRQDFPKYHPHDKPWAWFVGVRRIG